MASALLAVPLCDNIRKEREMGVWRRFLIAPIWRPSVVLASGVAVYIQGVLGTVVIFAFGKFAYGMELGSEHIFGASLVILAFTLTPIGLATLVASITDEQNLQNQVLFFLTLFPAFIGGVLWPVSLYGEWAQILAHFTPHYWAIEGLHDIMLRESGFFEVAPKIVIIAAFGLIPLVRGLWRFHQKNYL
jgi:ABC-2 type transport system permease protein